MFRKKGFMGLMAAVALTAMVTGCENPVGEGATEGKEGYEEPAGAASQNNGTGEEETGTRILAQNSNVGNIVSTDAGMYRIVYEELPDQTWAHRIYYVDYATAQEIVLCNDSSCNHDTDRCSGIIKDSNLLYPQLFIYKNQLYVFSPCDDSGTINMITGDSDAFAVTTGCACLYQMNLDGTNRRHMLDFPADAAIDENVFEWNGQLLFCEKKIEKTESSDGVIYSMGVERKLVSLDVDNGALSEVTDFPEELAVCGTYQDRLVCKRLVYPEGYTEEDMVDMTYEEWADLMKQSRNTYVFFDIATGTETEICSVSEKDYFDDCMVVADKMYISTGRPEILCVDLKTGVTENMVIREGETYTFVASLGDCIYCWHENGADEMYFWNPIKNEITRADLKIEGTDLLPDILAFNDDLIIAACDAEYIPNDDGSYEITSLKYGILKKEELYSGKVNYTPVTMCSDGIN